MFLVPDNLKNAINRAYRYNPKLNPSNQQLPEHAQVAVFPTCPHKPKGKSKTEVG
nr:hypothetical protein [Escherichia coli]